MKRFHAAAAALLIASAGSASAAPALWGIDLGAGTADRFDLGTGALLQQVSLGIDTASGIAIVGNTGYFTSSSDGFIRSFNVATGAVSASKIATTSAISSFGYGSISYDGAGFWVNDGSNGNKAYHITLAGVTDKSVSLSLGGANIAALDSYTAGGTAYLIASEAALDGTSPATYDVYTTTGAVVTPGLIANVPLGAGITANGSGFLVATLDGQLLSFDGAGKQVGRLALPEGVLLSDLSLVPAPAPAMLTMLGGALAALGLVRRRRA